VQELGIPVISPVRCLGLADQVAQKLHACTGPVATGRARDVLDILLIDMLGELDYPPPKFPHRPDDPKPPWPRLVSLSSDSSHSTGS
jgi:hypothetical protein